MKTNYSIQEEIENLIKKNIKFSWLVIDPPYLFKNQEAKNYNNAGRHYKCMTNEQLLSLKIPQILFDESLVFIFTTSPFNGFTHKLAKKWGLEYKSEFMIW